jgi:hypothetical protein
LFDVINAISTTLLIIRNDSLLLLSTVMRIVAVDCSHQGPSSLQDRQKFVERRHELKNCDVNCTVLQDADCFRRTFPGRPIPPNPP